MIHSTLVELPRAVAPPTTNDFSAAIDETRSALGWTSTRIIGTGHQAALWHPGILAKFIAARAWANGARRSSPSKAVFIIADHDANDGGLIAWPSWTTTSNGTRSTLSKALARIAPDPRGLALAAIPAAMARTVETDPHAFVRMTDRLEAIHAAMHRHHHARSLAEQLFRTNIDLVAPALADTETIATSTLMNTSLGRAVVERAVSDPRALCTAWNQALSGATRIARPLPDDGRTLPFWVSKRDQPRRRAMVIDARAWLDTREDGLLLPSAILASGMMRFVCNEWIHGTGARDYENAGARFWRTWIGSAPREFATVTATMTLDIESPASTFQPRSEIDANRARMNPEELDGMDAVSARRALAESIATMTRKSSERRGAYQSLRREVSRSRDRHAQQLNEMHMDERARRIEAYSESLRVDRTWGAWLHEREQIDALGALLSERIESQITQQA
ncbi:MAG: hypothetical protein O2800_03090 [Planctomycetota bacterium]|nr:hypothetical protein [Planctomycetota bacterium]